MRYNSIKKILLVLLIVLMLPSATINAAVVDQDYILDESNRKISIPLTYEHDNTIGYLGEEVQGFSEAQDLFLDEEQQLYIADTGNNRIVKLDTEGKVLGVFTGPEDKPLKEPHGIFVDEDGDMFIADTGNERIVHLAKDGKFVEEFVQPDSSLYDKSYGFLPIKIYIDAIGYMYIINKDDHHGLIIIDAFNRFRGYMAPARLGFSLKAELIRAFASKEQKDIIAKRLPPAHSNFVMHDDGMIYTTTIRVDNQQIRKLTSLGNNIYDEQGLFGEMQIIEKKQKQPKFMDLTVNDKGIITAIEELSGQIYQYGPEGNLLTVFGGKGNWKGKFLSPSSIVEDDNGRIYVLDSNNNNIQVFKPTEFIKTVHVALDLYYQGKYQEAVEPWEKVLKVGPNYNVAHMGIGKALLKQENYNESMSEYQEGEDKKGYSNAFGELRHEIFKKYFGWIVLASTILLVILIKIIQVLKRRSDKSFENTKTWRGGY